ncbi:serine/threonine-protein phosphatase 6 regulatory ankyrin repeat subunit B-like [Contarinia nasturtii]|uniref:serine/threonine-protein phosphatase 6 regulatory ankyrin repeat subunit B-like n=1 Tax=Contarinia nasturtii TaxID=265458 RepID=UPI0012D43A38|nr:serine/threonine-protein phosphatase 6 regulatory ankyrin repeat subunit B-like [Contarinia nasturtii]
MFYVSIVYESSKTIQKRHTDIAKILIENGANVNAEGWLKRTPLHMAAVDGRTDTLKMLIEKGANVNAEDYYKNTPLHNAAYYGHTDLLKILIEKGANVCAEDNEYETSLHKAARRGYTDIVEILIEKGANVDGKDEFKETPLHQAAGKGHLDIVVFLIENGAHVNLENKHKETPLYKAVVIGHTNIVRFLIMNGADVNVEDNGKETPLHKAVLNGYTDLIKILIGSDANVNAEDLTKETPLHRAAENGNIETIKFLIKKGANPLARNEATETPGDVAVRKGKSAAAKLLASEEEIFANKKYEKLDPLGSGQFGEVYKAIVKGKGFFSEKQTVAIKTLKANEENRNKLDIKGPIFQLLSELDIVRTLEKHQHIVSFIGAISENVINGELMLIFEFCKATDLKKFLQSENGEGQFVNQVEFTNGRYKINRNITTPTPNTFQQPDFYKRFRRVYDARTNEYSPISQSETSRLYTTTNLVEWSAQIANGLRFLASHNIVHCDLAARNIILCNNNTIKICDFGLAEAISTNKTYKRLFGKQLSLRWMAIEVLHNEVCNEKSDVWSFGLVMWEIFSGGLDPFPLIPDEDLNAYTISNEIEKMRSSFKRPHNATPKIFEIMYLCWERVPEDRPSFEELENEIFNVLNEKPEISTDEDSEPDDEGIDSLLDPNEIEITEMTHL